MKKLLLVLAFATSISFSFAQSANFGLRVGGNRNTFSGQDAGWINDGITPKISPVAGFYINSQPAEFFWIKTDFSYVNRAYTYEHQTYNKTLTSSDHYIDIYPLSPTFHFEGIQLFAGPAINVLVAGNYQDIEIDDQGNPKTVTRTDVDGRNLFQFGIVGGIEYEAPFGLNIGLRYVHGMSSLFEPIADTRVDIFNRTIMATLGFTFGKE